MVNGEVTSPSTASHHNRQVAAHADSGPGRSGPVSHDRRSAKQLRTGVRTQPLREADSWAGALSYTLKRNENGMIGGCPYSTETAIDLRFYSWPPLAANGRNRPSCGLCADWRPRARACRRAASPPRQLLPEETAHQGRR